MKKILIIIDNFLPGYKFGGPVKSISNLVSSLNNNLDILICTKNHDYGDKSVYKQIISNKITTFDNKKIIYLSKIDSRSIYGIIETFNPDTIYLNSFFGKSTQLVLLLNIIKFQKKIILAPRGELLANALNLKNTKKIIYLAIYKLLRIAKKISFHATDPIETSVIKKLFNITNVTELPNIIKKQNLSALSKDSTETKIIFLSRISRKKNLIFSLQLLKLISHDVIFDIYGPKEDIKYWQECLEVISQLPSNINVSYKGQIRPEKVLSTMRQYHVFLFPTLSENFGHAIVESMQAGLVPVISDQTPWQNLQKKNVGWSIPLNRTDDYIQAINTLCEINSKEYSKKSLRVIQFINASTNNKTLIENYFNFFNNTDI